MVNFPFTFSPVKEQLGLKCVFNQHNTEYNTHAEFFSRQMYHVESYISSKSKIIYEFLLSNETKQS